MCGIWCSILRVSDDKDAKCCICGGGKTELQEDQFAEMLALHKNRGPDISTPSSPSTCIVSNNVYQNHHLQLSGHVLWTQGPSPVQQPYVDATTTTTNSPPYSLLFNGDIYSFTGVEGYEESTFHPDQNNDGLSLFKALTIIPAPSIQSMAKDYPDRIKDVLLPTIKALRGPFAFVFVVNSEPYHEVEIWFGRDYFGRQSLLFSSTGNIKEEKSYHISSVSVFESVFEIPASGIFRLNLWSRTVVHYPYNYGRYMPNEVLNFGNFERFLRESCDLILMTALDPVKLSFETRLLASNADGDDVEYMAGEDKAIFSQLQQLSDMKDLTSVEILKQATAILDPYVIKFLDHLRRSVRLRLKAIAPYCKNCVISKLPCNHPRVGVLFSGGLDSTVIAYLAAEVLDKVDLLNVAFSKTKDANSFSNVPDRETGLESYAMLKDIFTPKGKTINLILVNETKEDVEEMRKLRIKTLISPLKSVIDDSVGCCLWFAARGGQQLSPIRAVLMGSGADELLGGYSRHRSAFKGDNPWLSLAAEMQFDLDRISSRNMGRDNRIVSDHGLSPRMPYLDEGLVHFLTQDVPIWAKCFPLLGGGERGIGEKILLRAAAYKLFGPEYAKIALFPKRAMQFGSRIAKLENNKEKGAEECDRLL